MFSRNKFCCIKIENNIIINFLGVWCKNRFNRVCSYLLHQLAGIRNAMQTLLSVCTSKLAQNENIAQNISITHCIKFYSFSQTIIIMLTICIYVFYNFFGISLLLRIKLSFVSSACRKIQNNKNLSIRLWWFRSYQNKEEQDKWLEGKSF